MNYYKVMEKALASKSFDEGNNLEEEVHQATKLEKEEEAEEQTFCGCSDGCLADKNFDEKEESFPQKTEKQKKEEETMIAEVLASLLEKLQQTYPNMK
jgi:hypothetical protein